MKRLNVPLITAGVSGDQHACSGKCTGKPRKDGYCYHDGGTRHPIGQCRAHRKSTPPTDPGAQATS
ncbi:MAG: hypothetical protein FJ314_01785 [SAR202 cluster bacterium]|nr:hypothetical protein [SAR202 cluster bacterium]